MNKNLYATGILAIALAMVSATSFAEDAKEDKKDAPAVSEEQKAPMDKKAQKDARHHRMHAKHVKADAKTK